MCDDRFGHAWTEITDDFKFEINPSNPRELIVTPTTLGDYAYVQYMVVPTPNLKCGGAGVTPPPVFQGEEPPEEYIVTFE